MKRYVLLFILLLTTLGFPQTSDKAVATYSLNDKLIGLSSLSTGLSDCSIRSVAGKVKKFEIEGDIVTLKLKADKKTTATVIVPLERVSDDDRESLFRHLITKNNVLRASGYSCDPDTPFSAFSLDRVY